MQPAHGHHGAPGGTGLKRRVLGVAFPQPGQEVSHVGRRHVGDLDAPCGRQSGRVAPKITPVCLERVLREAALDGQMVEIAPDRPDQCGQLSTSTTGTAARPWASATGAHVTVPACVLSPEAREASPDSAVRQPCLAISIAYGSVTLVSA